MILLSDFSTAKYKPSKRKTRCKSCYEWPGMPQLGTRTIEAGKPRIVINGGYGPAERNLTLCPECAKHAWSLLKQLESQLSDAIQRSRK